MNDIYVICIYFTYETVKIDPLDVGVDKNIFVETVWTSSHSKRSSISGYSVSLLDIGKFRNLDQLFHWWHLLYKSLVYSLGGSVFIILPTTIIKILIL